jgi:hypothetical protein
MVSAFKTIIFYFSIIYFNQMSVNFGELVRRAIKYIIEGLVVAIAAYAIPKVGRLSTEEIVIIALTAAATFAVLDVFVPAMGSSARNGAGLGIGLNLVRFPGGF